MESVLIDRSLVNPRKNVVVNNSSSYGGFMTRPRNTFSSSSYSSVSQLFLNLNAGTGGSMASFGSRPPPSRYSSLPSFSATPSVVAPPPAFPPPPLHQPPLLPLPFSKSATLPSPSPTKRIAATAVTTARSRDKRNKSKPDGNPRKEARSSGTTSVRSDRPKGESVSVVPQKSASPPPAAERKKKVKEGSEEEEERFAMESVYSLSPPPSCLPLPTFFLIKRPKAASAASCVAEAMGCGDAGGGGRVNAGATDDLRRLLRL